MRHIEREALNDLVPRLWFLINVLPALCAALKDEPKVFVKVEFGSVAYNLIRPAIIPQQDMFMFLADVKWRFSTRK
jgi:hypothetical protein